MQVWVMEHEPDSAQQAAQLVETFLAARRGPKTFRNEAQLKSAASRGKPMGSGMGGGPSLGVSDVGQAKVKAVERWATHSQPMSTPTCYHCG